MNKGTKSLALKKWRVSAKVVGSKYLGEFEAATKEEAEEKAMESDESGISLCHHCSSECEDPEVAEAFAEPVAPEAAPKPRRLKK